MSKKIIEYSEKPKAGQPWDVIIVGSGPAGLTAAVYTTRGAASTLILGGDAWGGQLMLTSLVDNYPGFPEGIEGPKLMLQMRSQAERFGAEFVERNATSIDLSQKPFQIKTQEIMYLGKTVIIASGASTKWLDVPGVKELIGKGVSSCAPCDAPFFKDRKVAVVGGGDSAMEEALTLTKYVRDVVLIHRRDRFRASRIMQDKAMKNPKIKIMWNTEVIKVTGKEKLESINTKNNETGKEEDLKVDGLFIAIGHKPESDLFKNQLEMDELGYIKVTGGHAKTSVEGVFVAGDVFDRYYKQAVTAAGSGCAAAMDTLEYLGELKG